MKKTLLTLAEWSEIMLDMPFQMEGRPHSKQEAMTMPRCCLKSKERKPNGFRADFGQLLKYGDQIVVVSRFDRPTAHPDKSHAKWVGNRFEYEDMWDCD